MTGRVHTDHEIVQEALGYGGDYMPSATLRDEARAALGRLVEARDTARQDCDNAQQACEGMYAKLRAAEAERDAAREKAAAEEHARKEVAANSRQIAAERDVAIQERDGEMALRKLGERESVNARARLERVEAALQQIADEPYGVTVGERLDAPGAIRRIDKHRTIARAALSDVTPPPSRAAGAVDE